MDISDIAGWKEPASKLIEAVRAGIGVYYEPTRIRKRAEAEADAVRVLAAAKADEVRALTQANRERAIVFAQTEQEILDRASQRIVHRELQRQKNIDAIVGQSVAALPEQVSDEPVDENWLTRFFNIAQDIGDERMQQLWGRILAGEVAKPGSFSLRSLECLRQMSKHEAELFSMARNCAFSFGSQFVLPAHKLTSEGSSEDIEGSGLSYNDILRLDNAGLIQSRPLALAIPPNMHGDTKVAIISYGHLLLCLSHESRERFEILGYAFTAVGDQIAGLVTVDSNQTYLQMIVKGYEEAGYTVQRAERVGDTPQGGQYRITRQVPVWQ